MPRVVRPTSSTMRPSCTSTASANLPPIHPAARNTAVAITSLRARPSPRRQRRGLGVVAAGGVGFDDAADVVGEVADRRALLVNQAPLAAERADAIADIAGADPIAVAAGFDAAHGRVRAAEHGDGDSGGE